jgi:predicted DNA-binding protein (UPF0251 family)
LIHCILYLRLLSYLMTLNEFAKRMEISRLTAYKRILSGELKATKKINPALKQANWVITEEALQDYLNGLNNSSVK